MLFISLVTVISAVYGASDSCKTLSYDYPYYSSYKGGITLELAQLECSSRCINDIECYFYRTNLLSNYEYECYFFNEDAALGNGELTGNTCSDITKVPYSTMDGYMYCENEDALSIQDGGNFADISEYEWMWATLLYSNKDIAADQWQPGSCYHKCVNDEQCKSYRSEYLGTGDHCEYDFKCLFFDDLQDNKLENEKLCKELRWEYPYYSSYKGGITLELAQNECKSQCDNDNECYFYRTNFVNDYEYECYFFNEDAALGNGELTGNTCSEITKVPYSTFDGSIYCENEVFFRRWTEFEGIIATLEYANGDNAANESELRTESCYSKCAKDEQCVSFRSEYQGKNSLCYYSFKCLFFDQ